MAYQGIKNIDYNLDRTNGEFVFLQLLTTQIKSLPSLVGVIAFFGPLIGLILSFDKINHEFNSGTINIVLTQPVYRDSFINGKFLAGFFTIFIFLIGIIFLIIPIGIISFGTMPITEEWIRILLFVIVSNFYLSLWFSMGLYYSIYFRREGDSALASIATWLFFTIFIYFIPKINLTNNIILNMYYLSPSDIYIDAISKILFPKSRILGPLEYENVSRMIPNPLSIKQSIFIIFPHIIYLFDVMILMFTFSYHKFLKEEIRS
jgi:ABC-2 type transport system permease protein